MTSQTYLNDNISCHICYDFCILPSGKIHEFTAPTDGAIDKLLNVR